MKNELGDQPPEGNDNLIGLDPSFTREIISRIQVRVAVRDFMVLILEGFSAITMGFLQLKPKEDHTKSDNKGNEI